MCPQCHSNQVRRSHRRGVVEHVYSWIRPGNLPYRCLRCDTRFWASVKAVEASMAMTDTETPPPLPLPPIPAPEKSGRRSNRKSPPMVRLRRWLWRKAHLELEILILLIIAAIGIIVGLWWALKAL